MAIGKRWSLERGGRWKEVLNMSQSMDFLSGGTKQVAVVERW